MRKILLIVTLFPLLLAAQTESHNFITYDTTFNIGYGNLFYNLRITRPKNMFVAGDPDTASRPAIIHMGGTGEVGANTALMATYGPHYYLANGWDGSVKLGNGVHYPIVISVQPIAAWPQTYELLTVLKYILNTYHINRRGVHLAGLSMGGMAWTALVCHQNAAGSEDGMKLITSIVALQGVSNGVSIAQQPYELGGASSWASFGHWAKKYGGKFFGLEGTGDYRGLFQVQRPMSDSVPGSAYTQFENIGGGAHCCWNSMYDPSATDWTSSNKVIQPNTIYPGTLGTYFKGENIFQWQLRQGDTALVVPAPSNQPPVAVAAPVAPITLPTSQVALDCSGSYDPDGKIASCSWTYLTGPAASISIVNGVASGLTAAGVYSFQLQVTDDKGATSTTKTSVTVNAAPLRTVTAIQITINGQLVSIPLAGTKITFSDGNTQNQIISNGYPQIIW